MGAADDIVRRSAGQIEAAPADPVGIAEALAGHGLILRGGFAFADGEDAPAGPSGGPARSVLLVGQAGAGPWQTFSRWSAERPPNLPDPLDDWSRETIGGIAATFAARAVFPSDRPFLPFQQWAMRAEGLRQSPLGILMHPEYGLWHAYRGALLFDVGIDLKAPRAALHHCDLCSGKPCLKACPVGARSGPSYDHPACLRHVRGADGGHCRTGGCLDRNACPEGAAWRYPADLQAFLMRAFSARRHAVGEDGPLPPGQASAPTPRGDT